MTQRIPETATLANSLLRDEFAWCDDHLLVVDKRQTPEYEIYLSFTRTQEIAHAIKVGIITHPDAITKACGCGLYLAALRKQDTCDWRQALKADFEVLYKAVKSQSEAINVLNQAKEWVMQAQPTPEGAIALLKLLHHQVQ